MRHLPKHYYLGALYPVVARLRDLPDAQPGPSSKLVEQVIGEPAAWWLAQRRLARLGPDPARERLRVSEALGRLQVMAMPARLRETIDASADYLIDLGDSRAPDVLERWSAVYEDLHDATRLIDGWHP